MRRSRRPTAILGDLRIGAQRSGQRLRRIGGGGAAADDATRGLAPFDPSFEGREDVAARIAGGATAGAVAEAVRTGAAPAMRHARHEEQSVEVVGRRVRGHPRIGVPRHERPNALVVF